MSSSVNEDQDQRNNGGVEDLTTMTIESLRARLLSERAISKASRERADELAKRVVELEEQLKLVSLQRKRAEKATVDVLAILESNGMSNASEAFDSNSDQETIISDSKVSDDTVKSKEISSNFDMRKHDVEACSSSEIDSSPSTGRCLSWKSSKESQNSLERKKYTETARRRCSTFTSNGSLPKRASKSCRRIRRRETRSAAEELCVDDNMNDSQGNAVDDTYTQACPKCADGQPANDGVKDLVEAPVSGLSGNGTGEAYFASRNGQDNESRSALQHQAQIIEQHEAEDRAQREWEEKVRENSSSVLDSCDPGNRSDVTEEIDEVKAPCQSSPAEMINSVNRQTDSRVVKTSFASEMESRVSNNVLIPPHSETGNSWNQKTSSLVACRTSSSEFEFHTSKGIHSQVFSGILDNSSTGRSHTYLVSNGSPGNPSMRGPFRSPNNGESSGSQKELSLMPQMASNDLESVLKALEQAKLSLNQNLHGMPPSGVGSSREGIEPSVPGNRNEDRMEVPVGCPGLFRLPTSFQLEATAKPNYLSSNSALSLANSYPEPAVERFPSSPYLEPRSSALYGDQLFTGLSNPFTARRSEVHRSTPPFTQGASGMPTSMALTEIQPPIPASRPIFETALDARPSSSGISTHLDPQMNAGLLLPSRYAYPTYPFYQEVHPQIPANERLTRNVSSMEFGRPSPAGFSFYDDHIRPSMYK